LAHKSRIAHWESISFASPPGKAGYHPMLITRLELENIKSYRRFTVDFRRGTTAISGENGAGKTTLVEAIGFALFDYLPYSQARFVREGEKYGRIIVQLLGGDDRPYTVERRCGSGSRWFIHDEEANARIEQSTDVLDKLHELFGIDRARPLDSLFRDALGVPQGTFTSIFLETPGKRKQTFDALLQIEDYKLAAEYLLETQHEYKDQRQAQQEKINQLNFELRDLDTWRSGLRSARQQDQEWKQLNAQQAADIAQLEALFLQLTEQARQVQALKNSYETNRAKYESALDLLAHQRQQVHTAKIAQQIVTASQHDYQLYQQAETNLQRLRQDEQRRSALHRRQAELRSAEAATQANLEHLLARLEEVTRARQQVVILAPAVEQQIELEKQRDDLIQKVTLYDSIVAEGKLLKQRQNGYQSRKEELERLIVEVEPLIPIADRLQEHTQMLTQLQVQRNERKNRQQQLEEKQALLQEKLVERRAATEKLRKAENNVALIEEHRREAEEMPGLQEQFEQISAHKHRLEGNIEGYARSRAQSAGGQCPLLHETCLNIRQRGTASLESYFENLLTEEQAQLATLCQQQNSVSERMRQIKKFVEALTRLDQYLERRDSTAEQLERINNDIERLERDITALTKGLEALQSIEEQIREVETAYNESKAASLKVRDLPVFQRQAQQLQEQIQQCEADRRERRQKIENLHGSDTRLQQVKEQLAALNDPRARSKAQLGIIAQESVHLQQRDIEQQKALKIQQNLLILQEQLAAYTTLDSDLARQEEQRQRSQAGYQNYLKHIEVAQTLLDRERSYQQQAQTTEQAKQITSESEQAYQSAYASFDETKLQNVKEQLEQLRKDQARLAEKMQQHQRYMNDLEKKIEEAETRLIELEAAQKEYQELDELHTITEYFRRLIKEAAPHVLKAMLNDISAEANRIFGEIMGDRSAQLSWQNDYEIILRRQGVNRTFAQLSGGEQMSAALAVRLALLKKLSTLNLAFFDEPTQNMDELRRMNLAEQIRRVRGFDQLIVISHDDTFEQGLDSLIRLQKQNGETLLQNEDAMTHESSDSIWGQNNIYVAG
jgi:exonuclease SbcC